MDKSIKRFIRDYNQRSSYFTLSISLNECLFEYLGEVIMTTPIDIDQIKSAVSFLNYDCTTTQLQDAVNEAKLKRISKINQKNQGQYKVYFIGDSVSYCDKRMTYFDALQIAFEHLSEFDCINVGICEV